MNLKVVNKQLRVNQVQVTGVATSSVLIIGDTEWITCASMFDTPPESFIVGREPLVTSPRSERVRE